MAKKNQVVFTDQTQSQLVYVTLTILTKVVRLQEHVKVTEIGMEIFWNVKKVLPSKSILIVIQYITGTSPINTWYYEGTKIK